MSSRARARLFNTVVSGVPVDFPPVGGDIGTKTFTGSFVAPTVDASGAAIGAMSYTFIYYVPAATTLVNGAGLSQWIYRKVFTGLVTSFSVGGLAAGDYVWMPILRDANGNDSDQWASLIQTATAS